MFDLAKILKGVAMKVIKVVDSVIFLVDTVVFGRINTYKTVVKNFDLDLDIPDNISIEEFKFKVNEFVENHKAFSLSTRDYLKSSDTKFLISKYKESLIKSIKG